MFERYLLCYIDFVEGFLNKYLWNVKSYDRFVGYFSLFILEIVGEVIESIEGIVRVVCNFEVESKDVLVVKFVK